MGNRSPFHKGGGGGINNPRKTKPWPVPISRKGVSYHFAVTSNSPSMDRRQKTEALTRQALNQGNPVQNTPNASPG